MDAISQFVNAISPSPKYSGKMALILAIKHTLLAESAEELRLTKDIYPAVAQELNSSPGAIQKKLQRAVSFCWQEGNNPVFNSIVGKRLTDKPKIGVFLSYCAFYIRTQTPFHACPVALINLK